MKDSSKKRDIVMEKISGIKLKDAGVKEQYDQVAPSISEGSLQYPSLYLNAKNTPDLAGKEVEDKVILIIEGKIRGHSMNEDSKKNKRETFDIDVKKIGVVK